MKTEFRKARLPQDLRSLLLFDRKTFSASDLFTAADWKHYKTFWMLVDNVKVGCCAFQEHVDFAEDIRAVNPRRKGSLYITTTGILPKYQGQGYGQLLKAWEIAYAYHGGFTRIITNTRSQNARMLELNRQFGFRRVRTTKGYYADPVDATVVMELRL
jgi:ribosomal protein S18 acetylase RimI-like enzyme